MASSSQKLIVPLPTLTSVSRPIKDTPVSLGKLLDKVTAYNFHESQCKKAQGVYNATQSLARSCLTNAQVDAGREVNVDAVKMIWDEQAAYLKKIGPVRAAEIQQNQLLAFERNEERKVLAHKKKLLLRSQI